MASYTVFALAVAQGGMFGPIIGHLKYSSEKRRFQMGTLYGVIGKKGPWQVIVSI